MSVRGGYSETRVALHAATLRRIAYLKTERSITERGIRMNTEQTMSDNGNRTLVAGSFLSSDRFFYTKPRNSLTEGRAEAILDKFLHFDDQESVREMVELLEGFKGLIESKSPDDLSKLHSICNDAIRRAFLFTTHFENALRYYLVHEVGCADLDMSEEMGTGTLDVEGLQICRRAR